MGGRGHRRNEVAMVVGPRLQETIGLDETVQILARHRGEQLRTGTIDAADRSGSSHCSDRALGGPTTAATICSCT